VSLPGDNLVLGGDKPRLPGDNFASAGDKKESVCNSTWIGFREMSDELNCSQAVINLL